MATKQTLASLLGNSDKRVQVNYDPSEITLSPTVQQAKGSGTVVQGMPQTNQALNFARAFNQVPQVLGQVKNIAQAQAVEDFSQITDEDEKDRLMADDKKISKFLGYDKAFQEALVKDYFVRNSKTITERFSKLANNPAQYGEDGEFDAAITNEKNTLIQELQEEFGNNPNRVLAINAFGDNILTKAVGETTAMYETNKINYTLDMEGAFLQSQIVEDGVDPSTAISNRIAKIKTLEDVDNQKVKQFFFAHTYAIGQELLNNDQHEKATEVVKAALDYQFFKGAKITGDERRKLSNLLVEIEKGADEMPSRVRKQAESTKDSYSIFLSEAAMGNTEEMVAAATSIFTELGYTDEQLEGVVIDTTSPNAAFISVQQGILTLLRSNPNELQGEVLRELNQSIRESGTAAQLSRAIIGAHSPEEYTRFNTEITDYVLSNLDTNVSNMKIIDDEGRVVTFSDPKVSEALQGAKKRIEWFTAKPEISQFNTTQKEINTAMEEVLDGINPVIKQSGYDTEIKDLLLSEGQRLWDESGGDFTVFNKEYPKAMDKIFTDLESEISERSAVLKNNSDKIKDINRLEEKLEGAERRSDKEKADFNPITDKKYKYPSLASDEYNKKIVEFGGNRDELSLWGLNERQAILDESATNRRILLPAHLIRYGFPTFDSVNTKLLNQSGLGISDIPMGTEIFNAWTLAESGYTAQELGKPTSTAQRKAIKQFEDKFGIKFRDDLIDFGTAINLYETQLDEFNQ
jgi:hypothetical protein